MDDQVQQILGGIVARFGKGISTEPKRCEGLLLDFCGDRRKEVNALVAAVKEGVAAELSTLQPNTSLDLIGARLTQRLLDSQALHPDAAKWAVRSWALALGVITDPQFRIDLPTSPVPSPAPASTVTRMDTKYEAWQSKLYDFSRRNPLLFYKSTRSSTVEIKRPDLCTLFSQIAIQRSVLAFPQYRIEVHDRQDDTGQAQGNVRYVKKDNGDLQVDKEGAELLRSLANIRRMAHASRAELSLNSLYLGFGLLNWTDPTSPNTSNLAPLILVPAELELQHGTKYQIRLFDDEIILNPTLVAYFAAPQYGIHLALPDLPDDPIPDIAAYFRDLEKRIVPRGWNILRRVTLRIFSFLTIRMAKDLEEAREMRLFPPIMRMLSHEPMAHPVPVRTLPDNLDSALNPQDFFQVVDADASQVRAMALCRQGDNLVIHGPPGTGKSQTIVNLIAQAVQDKKTVLFVSQKKAALDVVYRRLSNLDLQAMCLPAHGNSANKTAVLDDLNRTWQTERVPFSDPHLHSYQTVYTQRLALNEVAQSLNEPVGKLGWCIQRVHGHLLRCARVPNTAGSIQRGDLLNMERTEWQRILSVCGELSRAYEDLQQVSGAGVWKFFRVEKYRPTTRDELRIRLERMAGIIRRLQTAAQRFSENLRLPAPTQLKQLDWALEIASWLDAAPLLIDVWFDPAERSSLQKALQKGKACSDTSAAARRALTSASFSDNIFTLAKTSLLIDIRALASRLDRCLLDRCDPSISLSGSQSYQAIQSAKECIEHLLEHHEEITTATRLNVAPTASDSKRITALFKLLAKDCAPLPGWLDWDHAQLLIRSVQEAKEHASKRQFLLSCIEASWNAEVCKIDLKDLAEIFERKYGNPLARLISGEFREWQKRLASYWRGPHKPEYRHYLELIRSLRACLLEEAWFSAKDASLSNELGSHYLGWRTDFTELLRRLEVTIEILQFYDRSLPEPVRRILLESLPSSDRLGEMARVSDQLIGTLEHILPKLWRLVQRDELVSPAVGGDDLIDLAQLGSTLGDLLHQISHLEHDYGTIAATYAGQAHLTLEQAVRALESASLVVEQETALSRLAPTLSRYLGCHFEGIETRWNEIEKGLDIADRLSNLISAPSTFLSSGSGNAESFHAFIAQITVPEDQRGWARHWRQSARQERDQFLGIWADLSEYFQGIERYFDGQALPSITLDALLAWTTGLMEQIHNLPIWCRYQSCNEVARTAGVGDIVQDLETNKQGLGDLAPIVEKRFYQQWLKEAYVRNKQIADLDMAKHRALVRSFRENDSRLLDTQRSRVLATWQENLPPATNAVADSQSGLLRREMMRKSRRLPLRTLFAKIPELLLKLKPCVMMSPLNVATYLPLEQFRERFDLVIFDEGSQVPPEFAAGALLRSKQAVVVGDMLQLPPTDFFHATGTTDEMDEDEDTTEDSLESILGEFLALPGRQESMLVWHYRSQHQSLIQFSNNTYYQSRLLTFPSPWVHSRERAIRFVDVNGVYDRGGTRQNTIEAARVVDLIEEHFRLYKSKRSLGIITFSIAQEQAIREELHCRLLGKGSLAQHADWVDEEADVAEPFFIKALERVQGDERDDIIISIGYGPDETGRVTDHFGPLTHEGGERRLNVAVTRAKLTLTVVTTLNPNNIRITPKTKPGVRDLRAFLTHAQGLAEGRPGVATASTSEVVFEDAVAAQLIQRGYLVDRNVGQGGHCVDLAAYRSGDEQYRLGIGSDGNTYAEKTTARDRDRLAEDVLRGMGWKTYRVWSKEWLESPEQALRQLSSAIDGTTATEKQATAPGTQKQKPRPSSSKTSKECSVNSIEWVDQIRRIPYREYSCPKIGAFRDYLSGQEVINTMVKIVEIEQPIHVELLGQRIMRCYDLRGSRSANVKSLFQFFLRQAIESHTLCCDSDFVTCPGFSSRALIPRIPSDGQAQRPIEQISLDEIIAVAAQVLPYAYGSSVSGLAQKVSELLGYKALTSGRRTRIGEAIEKMVQQGTARLSGEALFPPS